MRNGLFLALAAAGAVFYRGPLGELASLSWRSELHQHIPLIPLVSAYLLFVNRREIFAQTRWAVAPGGAMLAASGLILATGELLPWGPDLNDRLSAMMSGLVLWAIGSFVIAYGTRCLRAGLFPMLFLVFMIPVPGFILDPCITFLQAASVEAVDLVFRATGVTFLRDGMIFSLPGIDVEVARQCSGIRSSLALLITTVLGARLFLHRISAKLALVAAIVPITVFKNALRIATLSILGSYVDPVFITGHWLHRSGGIPFFAAGLTLLTPVLLVLRRIERKAYQGAEGTHPGMVQEPRP